jgi:hypothetical protein
MRTPRKNPLLTALIRASALIALSCVFAAAYTPCPPVVQRPSCTRPCTINCYCTCHYPDGTHGMTPNGWLNGSQYLKCLSTVTRHHNTNRAPVPRKVALLPFQPFSSTDGTDYTNFAVCNANLNPSIPTGNSCCTWICTKWDPATGICIAGIEVENNFGSFRNTVVNNFKYYQLPFEGAQCTEKNFMRNVYGETSCMAIQAGWAPGCRNYASCNSGKSSDWDVCLTSQHCNKCPANLACPAP